MTRSLRSALAVVAALGCRNEPLAPDSAEGLTLALTLTQTSLQVGQVDTITVTLTNTNPYTVSLGAGACPLLFYVKDATGATVVPSGGNWFCIAIFTHLVFAPGEQKAAAFMWDTHSFAGGVYSVYGTFAADHIHLQTLQALVELH